RDSRTIRRFISESKNSQNEIAGLFRRAILVFFANAFARFSPAARKYYTLSLGNRQRKRKLQKAHCLS
ncbi:MAG TPA: hypothetical protein DEP43_02585, partial [Ruminococcaceae bacterium]|nr:hypothetical protein [Oscillospiraceae bacterium]